MDPVAAEAALAVLRAWRHEVVNELQAITGWLQLGRADRALECGQALAARLRGQGDLLGLRAPGVALTLLVERARARREGVALQFEILSDLEGLEPAAQAGLAEAVSRLLRGASVRLAGASDPRLNLVVAEDAEGYRFDLENGGPRATLRWPRET